jgi:hypothetical protein
LGTGSVLYDFDAGAPQAKLEVPLRVVMVGFKPGEVDSSKVLGEIPNSQRPGVLIPRGTNPGADNHPLLVGNETLINHGRAYYDSSSPFLVPYEYTWKPHLIYAPDAFTGGLLGAMAANSSTGELAKSGNRQYIETYNSNRGVYRGAGNQVAPNALVRFVDGEAVENWIAANCAYYDAGKQTLAAIPAEAQSLRSQAISLAAKAERALESWNFVDAVFAAQGSFRAAAAYRDLARGLPAGTTELEKGTKKAGASSCPSAKK